MRFRRRKPEAVPPAPPPEAPATQPTAVQGQQPPAEPLAADPAAAPSAAAVPATATEQPATSGPGPVPGVAPADGPRPPIAGTHPVARPAAAASSEADVQRAWLSDLDRKVGTRSYTFAALAVLTLAASIVAIVLAIDARENSAGVDDLTRVEDELTAALATSTDSGEEALTQVAGCSSRIDTLEDQIAELTTTVDESGARIDVLEDDLEDLRQQNAGSTGPNAP